MKHTEKKNKANDSKAMTLRISEATELLEAIVDDYTLLATLAYEQRQRFLMAAGRVARPGPWAKRELSRAARSKRRKKVKAADEQVLSNTGIRADRRAAFFRTPELHPTAMPHTPVLPEAALLSDVAANQRHVTEPRNCYVCKQDYHEIHAFYDSLCPSCADHGWQKRNQTADLSGRIALVTGARVKIGFQAALILLRAGARVVVTTRFPRDAALRYAAETGFEVWGDRLQIYGLDLRHTPSVEAFARSLGQRLDQLDFVIHNACQTVRRPVGFYDHLIDGERQALNLLSPPARALLATYSGAPDGGAQTSNALAAMVDTAGLVNSVALSQVPLVDEDLERDPHIFPEKQLDADRQQVDLRTINSWRLPLHQVSTVELIEVQLVNAIAPFVLNAHLKALMTRTKARDKHIVNVSAVEGQFSRRFKTDKHPHTNMAKAALNMMTRTSAADYVKDGIHMNSVDTGWVTDEDPAHLAERKTLEHGFHPPLDIVDGAARICDPILTGIRTGRHVWGQFLKDYKSVDW